MGKSGSASEARAHASSRNSSFANFPDSGDLVVYPARRVVRNDGAYTWHRAGLSEEHALKAVGGVLRITTPTGTQLQFQYERHVEHASGDWTWIGRAKNGGASDEIVVTFGEKAAFGSISQPGRAPLKLTMNGGASWLIETDRSKIADIDNPATRPRSPDFLIPPKIKAASGAEASTASSAPTAASSTASAQAAATTTVDVLLGYTTGFAAAQGGQSQAVTRLNNIVEIANQAYTNSQMDARVRLVHAMQVNYPDNTSNDSALEALTGFRAPSTPTTPDPAFAALRAARNQYGADLVSLVRQFNTPENDGCGIAWLIGGGQSGIDSSDEYFGYSVVSDGVDSAPDPSDGGKIKSYFCREETLAHELGHNMGSQHDRATATVDGVLKYGLYPYSFGYKTGASAGNFYTVMAYGDTGQATYRVFSNPRTTFCSPINGPLYSCGIENEADNARSLSQTMPLVAQFRASVVPPAPTIRMVIPNDMDGDGRSDSLWRNPDASSFAYWLMNGAQVRKTSTVAARAGASYWVAATGDFNGDRKVDVVWTSAARDVWLWTGTGADFGAQLLAHYPAGWKPIGAGDVNGDGTSDLFWHHEASGNVAYWLMSGGAVTKTATVIARASSIYRVAAIGDLNADGKADVVWTSPSRDLWLWTGDGAEFSATHIANYPAGWLPVGAGDLNNDGKSDLLWRNESTMAFAYWLMNGPLIIKTTTVAARASSSYSVAAIGDYNGDGSTDILWTSASRDVWLWTWDGGEFQAALVAYYPAGWQMVQ